VDKSAHLNTELHQAVGEVAGYEPPGTSNEYLLQNHIDSLDLHAAVRKRAALAQRFRVNR
jgi:hypothetical protein